jgi:amino acid transporter
MTFAAIVTNISILNATVLTSTRMPSAMAEDGYLPSFFAAKHKRFGTPWIAILISSLVYALLSFQTLAQLLTVYIWLRILVTVLTVLAAWRLRKTMPDVARPFRIPWGRAGLLYVVFAPMLMGIFALVGSDRFALKWGPIPVLLGVAAFYIFPKIRAAAEKPH